MVSLLVFGALAVALVLARRRGRLGLVFLATTALLAAAWVLARVAVDADYRDADGYVDCWPSCTALQDSVSLAIWAGPLVWIGLAVLTAVLAALSGPRGPASRDGRARTSERGA